jgi:hypothetical protein
MDPITGIGAGLAILGSKDILNKILGPTADYVGVELHGLIQKCNINLDNIFSIAHRKLGSRVEEEGAVSPRVLKHIIDEGRFIDEELTAEYYGGVLAASKTNKQNDDRAISLIKQLESMSSYQIRLHYITYYSVRMAFKDSALNPGIDTDCRKMKLFFPFNELADAMELDNNLEGWNIIIHAVTGLFKQGLVDFITYGPSEQISQHFRSSNASGFIITPILSGAELFLWGSGLHGHNGHDLLTVEGDLSLNVKEPTYRTISS